MDVKYIELLLVKQTDGTHDLVIAPRGVAHKESVVFYDGGKVGRVLEHDWISQEGKVHAMIAEAHTLYEAEAIYSYAWSAEETENETDSSSA